MNKNIVNIVIAGTLLTVATAACQRDQDKEQAISPPSETLEELGYSNALVTSVEQLGGSLDNGQGRVDFVMDGHQRHINLSTHRSDEGHIAVEAAVVDENNSLVWEQRMEFDATGELTSIEESDGLERLSITVSRSEDSTTESYVWEGTEGGVRKGKFRYNDSQSFDEAQARWQQWAPSVSSLNHNPEGAFLNRLLSGQVEIASPTGDRSTGMAVPTIEELCLVAAGCTLLKCPYGGSFNPVCVGCAWVVVGCIVCQLIGAC